MQVLQFVFLFLFLATCVTGSCWCRTINGKNRYPLDQVESVAENPRLGVCAQLDCTCCPVCWFETGSFSSLILVPKRRDSTICLDPVSCRTS